MGFNYGQEKKKFDAAWKKLREEYKAAGMSEESIQELHDFDLKTFRRTRVERMHTQPLSDSLFEGENDQCECMSALLDKFMDELSVNDKHHYNENPRFFWIDEIEDLELYEKITALPERDIDLITMVAKIGRAHV